jgi:hypothetical protein
VLLTKTMVLCICIGLRLSRDGGNSESYDELLETKVINQSIDQKPEVLVNSVTNQFLNFMLVFSSFFGVLHLGFFISFFLMH